MRQGPVRDCHTTEDHALDLGDRQAVRDASEIHVDVLDGPPTINRLELPAPARKRLKVAHHTEHARPSETSPSTHPRPAAVRGLSPACSSGPHCGSGTGGLSRHDGVEDLE